ncbi:MAG: hypothetical protein BroJett030_09070 [Alphaproteobacteria bacterium]|nr:MAG: hypothetical protein BroJett030_09070 [Alphaproteobacteria bacterium]
MKKGKSSERIDLFVVADAVLISLACMLVFLAYREITAAPVRYAQEKAQTILAVSDDFSRGDLLDEMRLGAEGEMGLAGRLTIARRQVRTAGAGAELSLFSDIPNLAAISQPADEFVVAALNEARAGRGETFGHLAREGRASYFRAAVPLRAAHDCRVCASEGGADFRKGDIIGLRTVRVMVGDEYARIIGMLLYTFAVLAAALMCVLGIIFPTIKRVRLEKAQMTDLTQSLERQAVTDPLTGLHNRRYFEHMLAEYLSEFNARGLPLGLLVFDLDHFKQINDSHGHDTGDLVLREVAQWLRAITRDSDVVARIGGEEFAVIAPHAGDRELRAIAERYRQMIGSLKIDIGTAVLRPTVSVGIASNSTAIAHAVELFKVADGKLYEAKRHGRNRVAA